MDTGIERRVVTLKDVALASGVSISTVSRILDERTPRPAPRRRSACGAPRMSWAIAAM